MFGVQARFPAFARLSIMKTIWRAAIEVGFIVFLFYSNLLMGEFARSGKGHKLGLLWAMGEIWTPANCAIALITGIMGYFIFEFLRSKF
jgi:hypothetical protein